MNRARVGLWLRWSWRHLRRRWALTSALALVIALGTGSYAGLGGTSRWRILSNDASYAALPMHDVRAVLPEGTFAAQGALQEVLAGSSPNRLEISLDEVTTVQAPQVQRIVDTGIGHGTGDGAGGPATVWCSYWRC